MRNKQQKKKEKLALFLVNISAAFHFRLSTCVVAAVNKKHNNSNTKSKSKEWRNFLTCHPKWKCVTQCRCRCRSHSRQQSLTAIPCLCHFLSSGKCVKRINELQSSEIAWLWLLNC